jgi:uncharacterized protein YbcI
MNPSSIQGQLKQKLAAVNNQVNTEIFGRGLRSQKVYIMENLVFIIANNQRVPALATLDKRGLPTREIDMVLIDSYKDRLRELVQEKLGLTVLSVLKDYDPKNEISGNILILAEAICSEEN